MINKMNFDSHYLSNSKIKWIVDELLKQMYKDGFTEKYPDYTTIIKYIKREL